MFFSDGTKKGVHPKERVGGAMLGCLKGEKTAVGMCCMEQTNKQTKMIGN